MAKLARLNRSVNLAAMAEDAIVALIAEGSVLPGERLPSEKDLALELGVSRPTVRQALGALAAKGMVEARPRSGTYVRSAVPAGNPEAILGLIEVDPGKIWELLEIRRVIDAEAAALAAKRRSVLHLSALRDLAREVEGLGPEGLIRHKAGGRAYVRFFSLIAASTGNTLFEHLRETIDSLVRGALPASRSRLARIPGSGAGIHRELLAILEAIEKGDPALARRRVVGHINGLENLLRAAFIRP